MKDGERYSTLDFLRGIAIVGVVEFHTFIIFIFGGKVEANIAGVGVYGVQLFFLVSALTMCMMWDRRKGETDPTARFYIRRLFRIAPPFWLALIGYIALFGSGVSRWSPDGVTVTQIFAAAFLVHPFWPGTVNAIVPGGWSIGVEVFFYFWFPILIRRMDDPRKLFVAAFALYLFNLVVVRTAYGVALRNYSHPELIGEFLYFQFFNQAPIFLIGIALYKFTPGYWKFCATIFAVWLIVAFVLKYFFQMPSQPYFWLIVFALLIIVWLSLKFEISFRPLDRLGELSYSIYLLHFAVIYALEMLFRWADINQHSGLSFFFALQLTLIICWLLGTVFSITVEKAAGISAKSVIAATL
jgi:exopolysaccharide production protein ExoZ